MSDLMFAPRGTRAKRHLVLPQVRVDEQEMEAVQWLMRRQSAKFGKDLSIADVLRLAVAHFYEAERAAAADPPPTDPPAPTP